MYPSLGRSTEVAQNAPRVTTKDFLNLRTSLILHSKLFAIKADILIVFQNCISCVVCELFSPPFHLHYSSILPIKVHGFLFSHSIYHLRAHPSNLTGFYFADSLHPLYSSFAVNHHWTLSFHQSQTLIVLEWYLICTEALGHTCSHNWVLLTDNKGG